MDSSVLCVQINIFHHYYRIIDKININLLDGIKNSEAIGLGLVRKSFLFLLNLTFFRVIWNQLAQSKNIGS